LLFRKIIIEKFINKFIDFNTFPSDNISYKKYLYQDLIINLKEYKVINNAKSENFIHNKLLYIIKNVIFLIKKSYH